MMAQFQRPYPLIDEIKMHLFTWAAEEEWKKLPVPLKEAINMAMNEIKVHEALKKFGGDDDRIDQKGADEKKVYFAIFKQKYLEFSDMQYSGSFDSTSRFIAGNVISRLKSEGASSQEYLEWFFKEFMSDEFNKRRYAPPQLKVTLSNAIVDKFIYLNKDRLSVRKQDIANYKVKNALMTLATEYLKRSVSKEFCKEFGQKIISYSRGDISLRKFSTIFINLLHTQGEVELEKEVLNIIGEDREHNNEQI